MAYPFESHQYILCCMRAEGKIHILFVFTSTKKMTFMTTRLTPSMMCKMIGSCPIGRRPRPYHTGEKIYYLYLIILLAWSTGRHPLWMRSLVPTDTIMSPYLLPHSTQTNYQHSYARSAGKPVYSSREQGGLKKPYMIHTVRAMGQ